MSFIVLNCQVVEWVDIFANPVFKNPGIYKIFQEPIKLMDSWIFLKFDHSLLRVPKISLIVSAEKSNSKT